MATATNLPPGGHIPSEPVARSTKEVDRLGINNSLPPGFFPYTFAHELAYCMNVQHHGNAKVYTFSSFDRYIITDKGFQFIDEDGSALNVDLQKNLDNHVHSNPLRHLIKVYFFLFEWKCNRNPVL